MHLIGIIIVLQKSYKIISSSYRNSFDIFHQKKKNIQVFVYIISLSRDLNKHGNQFNRLKIREPVLIYSPKNCVYLNPKIRVFLIF